MNLQEINIVMLILSFFIIIGAFIIGISQMKVQNTYIQCCGGHPCSDTYYTAKDNLCHLTLCENSPFTDKSQCTYPGKNISVNLTNGGKN